MPAPADLAARYKAQAADLRAAVAGLTRDQLLVRPVPGKMSTLEVVAHIADFEPAFADRIRRVAALDNPLLLSADENQFFARLKYQDRDIDEELALIVGVRNATARLISLLSEEDMNRPATHSEKGSLTLGKLIEGVLYHIPHHLPFIAAKRQALGV